MMSSLLNPEQVASFRSLLTNYQPNPEVLEQFKKSSFAVIAGPAAAGKDTLRNLLLAIPNGPYTSVVSTTSRPARPGETDGKTYHFIDAEIMRQSLEAGLYFQADLVHDQQLSALYIDEVTKLGNDKIGLSILVVKTEKDLRKLKSDIKTIFLVPPSLHVMLDRLRTERDFSDEELSRRLKAACAEVTAALASHEYYCIVSDGKELVRDLADDFLKTGRKDETVDQDARQHARTLLAELDKQQVL